MANVYCQLSDVKAILGLQSTTNDTWIASQIAPAQAFIDAELGYSFQSSTSTKTFNGNEREELVVGWISSVSAVTEDGRDILSDVVIGPENESPGWKLERLTSCFNRGRRNISVTGTWGFASVPEDIARACARIVAFYVKMRDTNYSDVLIEQGAARQKYLKDLPQDVQDILKNHRIRLFK